MGPFEKNCWYWAYINSVIERDIAMIPNDRKMMVKLEELAERADEVAHFVSQKRVSLKIKRTNEAFYKIYSAKDWSSEQLASYDKYCGRLMRSIYGETG